ncbi:hypothetical protein [Parageobacillus thermoglucosidasius]|uniref:hypothetical protein n=1 Tax=Parageobacillus thermoglucosidasius TaxID=1426 RepID=UPI000B583D8D|nr:hypothetical protein [Parageobacillus thermoglucosidasius]OUM91098.1 MAG: hypothetical protein BAA00_16580 [Parageobacillus thermoglucosidasius]
MEKIRSLIQKYKVNYKDGNYIYFLLNGDEIVYIGRTVKIFPPVLKHEDKDFSHVSMLPVELFDFDGTIEDLYIHLIITFKPKYNTMLPSNDRYMTKGVIKKRFNINGYELNRLIKKNGARPVFLDYYDINEIFRKEKV